MISKLPLELIFEIISHMDLEQLLNLITAYPVLQSYTVIITDLPITKGSRTPRQFKHQFARPSIEQLFPNVDRLHFNQKDQVIPHKHIRIFDLCDPCIRNGVDYYSATPRTHSCRTLIAMSFSDGEKKQNGVCFIPMEIALEALVDRLTFVYSERTVSHRIHGELKELRWKTGCKIQLDAISCLAHLQRKTLRMFTTPRRMRFTSQKWLGLTELHLEHPDRIELGDLHSNIKLVSATFTREGSDNCAPLFSITSAKKLQTLIIKYVGEYVPVISVKNAYNINRIRYRDNERRIVDCENFTYDTFRLIRICDTNNVLPVSHTNQMENYAGDLSFLQRCTFLSLIGVPDWFVLLYCPLLILEELHWDRIDPTPMPQSMDSYRLICPELYVVHIRSVISHDMLPFIANTTGEGEERLVVRKDSVLDLTIEAPGFNLNGLLDNLKPFDEITIRAYPFRKCLLEHEPALIINRYETMSWRQCCLLLRVSGDVYLKFLEEEPFPSHLHREMDSAAEGIEGADLDIGRTAAMNHGKVSMLWFAPIYGTLREKIRLRCCSKQEVSVNLVTSTETDNHEFIDKVFLIDKEITKVFIDGHQTEIPQVSPHCKHHCDTTWEFRQEIMTYKPCRSVCLGLKREMCGCIHLDHSGVPPWRR